MCTRVLICSPNLHHLQRWSKFAPGCKSAPGCIFIKHCLYDQNTPQVQIYTLGVNLHRGVYYAYTRGFRCMFARKSQTCAYANINSVGPLLILLGCEGILSQTKRRVKYWITSVCHSSPQKEKEREREREREREMRVFFLKGIMAS